MFEMSNIPELSSEKHSNRERFINISGNNPSNRELFIIYMVHSGTINITAAIIPMFGFWVRRQAMSDAITANIAKPIKENIGLLGIKASANGKANIAMSTPKEITADIAEFSVNDEINIHIEIIARPNKKSANIAL